MNREIAPEISSREEFWRTMAAEKTSAGREFGSGVQHSPVRQFVLVQ